MTDRSVTKQEMSPQELLDSLRWKPDMKIVNHDGEHVWLKECFNEAGKRIGITDCCPVDAPCDWHRLLSENASAHVAAGVTGHD